jgi:hypothetical protein
MDFCKRHMKEGTMLDNLAQQSDGNMVEKQPLHWNSDLSDVRVPIGVLKETRPKFEAETGPAIGSFEHFIEYQRKRGRVEMQL